MEKVFITDKQGNKVLPKTHISAVYDDEGNDLGSHLGAFEDEVRGLVDTPHQEYVTVATYASLPASGSEDTIYRVSNYDGSQSQVTADVYSEYAWDGTQYVFLCVKSTVGEVFDISAYHNNAKYADLNAALTSNTGGVPQSLQKGGMSVKFVQSSDNNYVQYRLKSTSFNTTTSNWVNVEDELVEERNARKLADTALQNAISTQNTEIDEFEDTIRTQIDEYLPIQIEGNVTNAPDEEDLTSVSQGGTDVLKFKNRNNLYGMGMIILRRDKTFAEQLTQTNTIYVIQYDFTLTGDVTIPANCILEFDGGSISGEYTITGQNTGINTGLVKIFSTDVTLAGTWNVVEAYPEWFGLSNYSSDASSYILKCYDICKTVKLLDRTYLCNIEIVKGSFLIGSGVNATTISPYDLTKPVIVLSSNISWNLCPVIKDFKIIGDNNRSVNGIQFSEESTEESIYYGRCIIDNISFYKLNKGFYKPKGNIGCLIQNCSFDDCNYGYYAQSVTGMHAGCDTIYKTHIRNCIISGMYITSNILGSGQTIVRDCILELNYGFAIIVDNYNDILRPKIHLENVWNEQNGRGQVEINGNVYTGKDYMFVNCAVVITNSNIINPVLIGLPSLILNEVSLQYSNSELPDYKSASIRLGECTIDRVDTPKDWPLKLSNFIKMSASYPLETKLSKFSGNFVINNFFDKPVLFQGSSNRNTVSQEGSPYNDIYQTLTVNPSDNLVLVFTPSSDSENYLYYRIIYRIRNASGSYRFGLFYNASYFEENNKSEEWRNIAGVIPNDKTKCSVAINNTSNDTIYLDLALLQVCSTNNPNEALDYINENLVYTIPVPSFGSTSNRPSGIKTGFSYFDITLNKPVYWTGSAWVDATGATV